MPTPQSQIESLQRALAAARADIQGVIARVKVVTGVGYSSASAAVMRLEEDRDCAQRHMREAQDMTARWKKAVEGVTPPGSEYVDDPERCADFIRFRSNYPPIIIALKTLGGAAVSICAKCNQVILHNMCGCYVDRTQAVLEAAVKMERERVARRCLEITGRYVEFETEVAERIAQSIREEFGL